MQSSRILGLGDGRERSHFDYHRRKAFCRYRTISCSLWQTDVLPVGRRGERWHDTEVEMREPSCEQKLMVRALHPRWPYRRSHSRHDLHWLVRVRPRRYWCSRGRGHTVAGFPPRRRRPYVS